ncbi:hypothetical protein JTB14_003611 [Gonioctena quinquepunctata]|nr:hypothetical protein JTB14_003611 [Gonioctena quinquepunctata]
MKCNEEGRFMVSLPLEDNIKTLGKSFSTALKRFEYMEKKLERDSNIRQQYHDFTEEYIELCHMTKIEKSQKNYNKDIPIHYLCHHEVFKESSITPKCRVVHVSAIRDSGISLDDTLMIGPKLQDNSFNILVRFRKHNVAIMECIENVSSSSDL